MTEPLELTSQICHIPQLLDVQPYLEAMSQRIAEVLAVSHVLIGQPDPNQLSAIVTRVTLVDGVLHPCFTYTLAGTPCEEVCTGERVCVTPRGVAEAFPTDAQLREEHISAYAGAPVLDREGRLRSLLVVMDRRPRTDFVRLQPILEFVAMRISVELDRERQEHDAAEVARRRQHADRMQAMGQLATGIAHDFNNMLAVMRGSCDLLRLQASASQAEQLQPLESALQRCQELSAALLSYGLRRPQERRNLTAQSLLATAAQLLQHTLGAGITLRLELPDEELPVQVDEAAVQDALVNLCLNARDAIGGRGRISLAVVRGALSDFHPQHPGAACALLIVEDDGPGVPAELQQRIFEPFFTTKDAAHGTGMGLAQVYATAEAHGGEVGVYSEPGQGAVFHLSLPLSLAEPEPEPEPAVPTDRLSLKDLTGPVLVISSDRQFTLETRHRLESLGARVACSASSLDARRLVESAMGGLACAVIDLRLGDEVAMQTVQSLWAALPLVVCSGFTAARLPPVCRPLVQVRKPLAALPLVAAIHRARQTPSPG